MKLLLSARDPGAAGHIAAIASSARRREDIDIVVYSADVAHDMLAALGLTTRRVQSKTLSLPLSPKIAEMLREARLILEFERPDAVLVGLSHLREAGIDEALVAQSVGRYPCYAMQDFWGDVNRSLSVTADRYFVIDRQAAKLTEERHGVPTTVVGSPKHAAFEALDAIALRISTRQRLGIGIEQLVLGYFGQALLEFDGYARTVSVFAEAVKSNFAAAVILYRPHPRETSGDVSKTLTTFRQHHVEPILVAREFNLVECLAASDIVLSVFSSCGYDALFLNRFSAEPVNAAIYLLFDDEMRLYFRSVTGLVDLPPAMDGLAISVQDPSVLAAAIAQMIDPLARQRVWQRVRQQLPDPRQAANRILDFIQQNYRLNGRSASQRR